MSYLAPRKRYVKLLVNEEPMKIGLCAGEDRTLTGAREEGGGEGEEEGGEEKHNEQEWSESLGLCKLEVLGENAFKMTHGFSTLVELCKTT